MTARDTSDLPAPPAGSPGRRRVLFLQGPISPFFAEVAASLAALGHEVHRIHLNLGDVLFWRRIPGAPAPAWYQGPEAAWPGFIRAYLDRHAITDLVLLGERRDYHSAAIAAAEARGAAVTVTDFGYFRPDWITLESTAMGGGSLFPREAAAIHALAGGLPPAQLEPRLADSFPLQAFWDVSYHLASMLPWPFRHYRSHHLHHPLATYAGIGWRLLRRGAERAEGARVLALAAPHPHWVFAMQMESDFSVRAYSPYRDMDTPVAETVRSFARHAPADARLVCKVHPLDPCLKRWGRRIPAIAAAAGVRERVLVAHHGPLDAMLSGARGLLTVNSTVGMRALALGRPVKALGRAVWDVPGLTHQGSLDAFWSEGRPPEPRLRDAFMAALQATTQVHGVFYGAAGRALAVAGTVARLHEGRVGVPVGAAPAPVR